MHPHRTCVEAGERTPHAAGVAHRAAGERTHRRHRAHRRAGQVAQTQSKHLLGRVQNLAACFKDFIANINQRNRN
jgi:hypothetical protein